MASRVLATAVVCLLVIIGSTVVSGYIWPKKGTYATRWDKVDTDDILDSKRLMKYYFNCLMGSGPCPPDGRELKSEFPHNVLSPYTEVVFCLVVAVRGSRQGTNFLGSCGLKMIGLIHYRNSQPVVAAVARGSCTSACVPLLMKVVCSCAVDERKVCPVFLF